MAAFPAPTQTYRSTSYDAISPALPALSQKGKNVIITGGGAGIGQAVALSFAKASVTNLAILGRRLKPLEETKDLINASYPNVSVHVYTADVTDEAALNSAFSSFAKAVGGPIHTLIANAGVQSYIGPSLGIEAKAFLDSFTINAIGTLNTVKAFIPHIPSEADSTGFRARIIHTSSGAAHVELPYNLSYCVTKAAAVKVLQHVASEHPDIFVVNYHPGIIETDMDTLVAEKGMNLEPKDDISLPADWTVWAASPESAFVGSGRFVWAHWDVSELKELFDKYKSGEEKDGALIMGGLPVAKNFTLGLTNWP